MQQHTSQKTEASGQLSAIHLVIQQCFDRMVSQSIKKCLLYADRITCLTVHGNACEKLNHTQFPWKNSPRMLSAAIQTVPERDYCIMEVSTYSARCYLDQMLNAACTGK